MTEKVAGLRDPMQDLQARGQQVEAARDGQVSLTDPDTRFMVTSGKGTGIVGYNGPTTVDVEHHQIVAHAATNVGSDRANLTPMSLKAQDG